MYLRSNDTAGHLSLGAQWTAQSSNYIRVQDAEYLDYLDYLAVTLYRCRIYLDYLAVTPLQLGSNFSHFLIMDQNRVKENYILTIL